MRGTPYESLVVFVVSFDRPVMAYLLLVNLLFAVGITSLVSKGRRWLELVTIGVLVYLMLMAGSITLFYVMLDRQVIRLESLLYP
jgi:hypothetical protein